MANIPFYVYATFGVALLSTIYIFYRATQKSKTFLFLIAAWLLVQSLISSTGFYTVNQTQFPRFQFLLLPPIIIIIILFNTQKGKAFIDGLNLKTLTLIHIVRIPVEIVLYWLFLGKAIPELMTFEGRNFDIIAGITAPFIYYLSFVSRKANKTVLIIWNVLCLGLLLNIFINGLLSAPTPFQQFGFNQPNIAILHFPIVFLPACIVPLILFSHLSSLRQLTSPKKALHL